MSGVSDLTPQQISIFQQASKASDVKRGKLHTLGCWLNVKLKKWETADDVLKGISSGAIDFQDLRKMKPDLVHKVAEAIPKIVKDESNQGEVAVNLRKKLTSGQDQAAILSTIKKVLATNDKKQIRLAQDLANIYQESSAYLAKERVEERGLAKDVQAFKQHASSSAVDKTQRDLLLETGSLTQVLGIYMSLDSEIELRAAAKTIVDHAFVTKTKLGSNTRPRFEDVSYLSDVKPKLEDIAKNDKKQIAKIQILEELWLGRQSETQSESVTEKSPVKDTEKAPTKSQQPIDLDKDDWFNKGSNL